MRRRGGHPTDLLVMRGFLPGVVTAGGPSVRRAYIRDPVLMSLGKTAEHHYGAMVGNLRTLSEMGAKSICIHHYSWDGAMYTAIRNMMQARHALPHKRLEGGGEDGGAWLKALLDWQIYTRCSCHDGSLALEWSLKPFVSKDDMRDLFIVVESMRNSNMWLRAHLVVEDFAFDEQAPWQWWTVIGLPPKWASRLADINLRWDGASLRLNVGNLDPSSRDVTDVVQTARECILHVCRFKSLAKADGLALRSRPRL